MNSAVKSRNFTAIFALILFALVFICHGLSLKAQFMVDDFAYIHDDQNLAKYKNFSDFFLKADTHHYKPFDILINISLFKYLQKPKFLYGANLLLFYFEAYLLSILVRKLTLNRKIGALTAILFAVHPINAEMLSHITFNSVFASGGFLQGSMLCFWQYTSTYRSTKKWLFSSLLLFLFAILSMETSLLLPAYLCLISLIVPANKRLKILRTTIPFWGMAILYFTLWIFMAGPSLHLNSKINHLDISFLSYTATLSFLLKWFIGNLFLPENFVFIKSSLPLSESLYIWNIGLIMTIGLLAFLIWKWRAGPKNFALGWFLIGFAFLLPASTVHAYSMGIIIEPHWFYFSSMGFFMLFALMISELKKYIQPAVYSTLLLTIIFYWGIMSYRHHTIAKTEIGYLEYWLKISPKNLLPALMLGNLYGTHKDLPIAEELVDEMALQSEFFIKMQQYVQATKLIEKLIATQPLNSNRKFWEQTLTALYIKTGAITNAENRLIKFKNQKLNHENYLVLAKELERLEIREKAIEITNQGLQYYPNNTDLIFLKIIILANQNRFKEARAILKANPSDDARFIDLLKQIKDLETKFPEYKTTQKP